MALVLKDRVKVLATTTGTGTFTLGAAVTGYQDFSVIGDGNTTYYTIAAQASPDWEVGIGTYTASGTLLSRDTILESSNGGAAVDFPAGTKDVFVTYPAERATYLDTAGSYPVQNTFNTLNASNAVLTAGTVATTPVSATDIANKSYVDTIAAAGISYHSPVRVESPTPLNATYNNGTAGVGATLTNAGTQVALVIDGVTVAVNDRVLIYTQTNATQNGVYVVTNAGSGSTNWVLTRSSDADTYAPNSPNALGQGDGFYVTSGNTGAGELYVCNTPGTITFGTTNITFTQISSAQIYSAGTGLTLSGTTFSITDTGTAGTYGNASTVPVITTNAQGQVTSVTDTAIAIASGAVSGLAASATTDTTNASNITSGTLGTSRLSGSYTGITGVGTLSAGTWNGSTIGATYGGTGLSSFAAGDLIYADSSTTLARLADTAVGNALISGGASADPSWGKIGLATHVDGILPVANGGTGNATNQSASVANSATFNDGGSGAASGSTFNGSSPLTISYNTIGAYPTTNPAGYTSNTGTVTSVGGTGTVNGLTLTGTVTTSGNLTLGGTLSGIANSALTNSSVTVNGTSIALGASGTITANNPNALTINNGGAGAASGTTYNGSSAITISYNTVGAPSTTGTGASGTWAINISGTAATATSAPSYLPLAGGTMTGTITNSANSLVIGTASGLTRGYLYNDTGGFGLLTNGGGWAVRVDYGANTIYMPGYAYSDSSFRAPIFYDSNNTAFYLDPNSASRLSTVNADVLRSYQNIYTDGDYGYGHVGLYASTRFQGVFAMGDAYKLPASGIGSGNLYGIAWSYPSAGGAAANLNTHGALILENGAFLAALSGSIRCRDDMRAPIFYDSNDTGYYIDPNTTATAARLRGQILIGPNTSDRYLRIGGNGGAVDYPTVSTSNGNLHIDCQSGYGLYLNYYSGNPIEATNLRSNIYYDSNNTGYYVDPASSSSLNQINGRPTTNLMFYEGFTLDANTMSTNATGFTYSVNAPYTGPIIRISTGGGYDLQFNATYGGVRLAYRARNGDIGAWYPWSVVTTYDSNPGGDLYANRFYDAQNSGFYCDPNSTSNFNVLELNTNTGSGNWPQRITHPDRGIYFINTSGSAIPCYFTVNSGGTLSGYIVTSGGTTQYITSSDYRMKENVQDLDKLEALNKIMSVKPRTFNWLEAHGGKADLGFIAHELQEIAPECVAGAKDAMMPDGKIMPQGVDTSFLMPTLCAAIQKQQEMIEQLMAKVAVLEGV